MTLQTVIYYFVNLKNILKPRSILLNFFLRKTKIFFRFLLLHLAILMYRQYFPVLQTLKLNNKNQKNEEIKVL